MQRADEVFAWMALSRAPALDAAILSAAFELLGGIAGLFESSDSHGRAPAFRPRRRRICKSAAASPSSAERAWIKSPHHHLVAFTDPRYPGSLHALSAPADRAVCRRRRLQVLNDPQLAIVGSRNPTPAGRETAFEFAESLAARGLAITSGLAEGIDSAAHRGALAAQGITLAVLGNGIDRIYPRSNQRLSEEIRFRGALISEFPLGTPPRRENFPQRNRIIAALSLGTLVVEAARRSGSLITARLAGDQNRELFAVPGSIHNPLEPRLPRADSPGRKTHRNRS